MRQIEQFTFHFNDSDFNEHGIIILYVIFMNNDFTYMQDEFLLSTM